MDETINFSIFDENNGDISSAFVRANSEILKKHKISTVEDLENVWYSEHRIRLSVSNKKLIFNNTVEMTMFLVKWGM
jgi:hypothetical protein